MDFNKTVDFIIRDLEEAREIIDDLKNYQGVPAIQVEMAKSKCRNAAEAIALLKNKPDPVKTEVEERRDEIPQDGNRRPETEVEERSLSGDEIPQSVTLTGIFADTFEKTPDCINEKLGNLRDDNDFSDYFKSQPVSNLSQAIGINDRFLFIRELFSGNSETYSKAILKIDEAKNLPDAKALILEFAGDRIETEAGQQLLDLVKRKFPEHE